VRRGYRFELLYLPGLTDVVRAEVAEVLPGVRLAAVPGREDSLAGGTVRDVAGELRRLRTVVAAFQVLTFPVPRPRSLLSGEYLPHIAEAIRAVPGPRSLRIEAAGRDSTVLRTLAGQLAQATGLPHDPEDGECVLRLRRTPDAAGSDGWDVLVRLSPRPLSARPWRVRGHPAAANATVAAALVRLTGPRPGDRVANLMCGSGTLLIERLLAGPAAVAVGVDSDPDAVAAAEANAAAAGLRGRTRWCTGDVEGDGWLDGGPFDVLLADPPWGDKAGRHDRNEDLHAGLLSRAADAAAPGARLAVLTHEVKIMNRCIVRFRGSWERVSETRVYHKGHHPRIYVLRRCDGTGAERAR